ncbi:hypothetical protein FB451DRAFT_1175862 [Mycena latifolia]|nr:hypothetical protein FB451DRAFT_1175862 [Mycena latifolia]
MYFCSIALAAQSTRKWRSRMAAAAYDTNTPTDNTSFIDEGKRSHLGSGSSPTRRAWPSTSARHSDMSAAADATRYPHLIRPFSIAMVEFATCSKGAARRTVTTSVRPPAGLRHWHGRPPAPRRRRRRGRKNGPAKSFALRTFKSFLATLRLHHRWIRCALVGVVLLAVIAVGGWSSKVKQARRLAHHRCTVPRSLQEPSASRNTLKRKRAPELADIPADASASFEMTEAQSEAFHQSCAYPLISPHELDTDERSPSRTHGASLRRTLKHRALGSLPRLQDALSLLDLRKMAAQARRCPHRAAEPEEAGHLGGCRERVDAPKRAKVTRVYVGIERKDGTNLGLRTARRRGSARGRADDAASCLELSMRRSLGVVG